MKTFSLELELFSKINPQASSFELWLDGERITTSSLVSSSGTSLSFSLSYGGDLPSSLSFRFIDQNISSQDRVEIRSVRINERQISVNDFLSATTLDNNMTAEVNIPAVSFLFGGDEAPSSDIFIDESRNGPPLVGGGGAMRLFKSIDDHIFTAGSGRDHAILGGGADRINGGDGNDLL